MIKQSVIDELAQAGIAFKQNECVASRSTFKVGGIADIAVFPTGRDELVETIRILRKESIRTEIIGNASNVLFAFDHFDGALVFTSGISNVTVEGNRILADCGSSLTYLSQTAAKSSLSGLEFAYGIPGLVGGSVYMNAGAYGSQMSEVVEYTDAYDLSRNEVVRIYDHGFAYRKSIYMDTSDLICLGACFSLKSGDNSDIMAKMSENMDCRRKNQPLEFPSAGSYFKRPQGYFAGKLIEDCGLKGLRVGGAEVSVKHAGFIVNRGGATWRDILELEEKIKEIVMSRYSVLLEREVRLIG